MNKVIEVIHHFRRAALLRDGAGLTDAQLLGCFVERRDEAAFAALVKQHGPMVWSVCRRLLNPHDAEDAFQTTFLVLVRKAASVVPRERLANWLYGVAHRTALQARRTAARRGAREKQVTEMPEPAVTEQDPWRELQPLLDQALSRLPDSYREVIVLSDLEGKPRKEVARQLGLPEGTVGSRLARARAMLAKRLARHGLGLSGAPLAAVLSQNAASAGVPNSALSSTIEATTLVAAGHGAAGVISVKVVALTAGVLKTMFRNKMTAATTVLLALSLLTAGGSLLTYQSFKAEEPKSSRSSRDAEQAKQSKKQEFKPKPDAMTTQELLDKMAKVYGGCKSYRDTGVVKTVFVEAAGNRTVEKPFKTAFVRPDRFRFEYTENQGGRENRYIVWRKGKEVQTWWDVKPGVEKPDSLELALAGATGVSGGSAPTVAALLLSNEVSWGRLTGLTAAKRLEGAKLDKADCFRVAGKFGNSARILWLDKKTFLVLRIDSKNKFDNFSTEETTTYYPVIDEEISDKALEFDPPKEK